jgi:hypothetical protein
MRSGWIRIAAAIVVGNALGAGAWLYAQAAIPRLSASVTEATGLWVRVGVIAIIFILLAAPPVLMGALGAWLARRAQLWVGLACGLWAFGLIQTVPPTFPIAKGVWYAPTVLVLLSTAFGGWLMDLRAQAPTDGSLTTDDR